MVAKMMRWRPWPPLLPSAKFLARLLVASLRGVPAKDPAFGPLVVEVRWKGPRVAWLRRSVRRNCTREAEVVAGEEQSPEAGSAVEWNEEFQCECTLTATRDGGFHPWEISLAVVNGSNNVPKTKLSVLGTASLNLADFVSEAKEKTTDLSIPLLLGDGKTEPPLSIHLTVSLLELGMGQGSSEITHGTVVPVPPSPSPIHAAVHTEKDEVSSLMRKVKIFTDIVSTRKSKKTCREDEGSEGRFSARSDDAEYTFDTDSAGDDLDDREIQEGKQNFSMRKSFSYGTLASTNVVGGSFYSQTRTSSCEDWVFYSHRRSDVGSSQTEEAMPSIVEQPALQAKRSILPWRKRKLSFRAPKVRGVPLLNKDYGEEGGDDIDFDRRQMSSSDESLGKQRGDEELMASRLSDFGDDSFVVGSWETKEVVSRDGHMKISAQVFFASIDQRSERAAGESACTVLVAVMADWFQNNRGLMPNQSQFDSLIRDGSWEWRKLCKNQVYQERFPDKHFDLETVLEAGIRPLEVVPSKSFVGFFHPEDISDDNSTFGFLHGAMSFDSIWDEISQARTENMHPDIYIVSWNDHLFVLKIEPQAYYIIDTLGERLHEGCDRAYVLKFDENSVIRKLPPEEKRAADGESKEGRDQQRQQAAKGQTGEDDRQMEEDVVSRGKESCREYIKNFLAAIPIRELQADIKKGKTGATAIHRRLQIEFHYAQPLRPSP